MTVPHTQFIRGLKAWKLPSRKLCSALVTVVTLSSGSVFGKFSLPTFRKDEVLPYLEAVAAEPMRFEEPELTHYFTGKPSASNSSSEDAKSESKLSNHAYGQSMSPEAQKLSRQTEKISSSTTEYSAHSSQIKSSEQSATALSTPGSILAVPVYVSPILTDDCAPKAKPEDLMPFFQYPTPPQVIIETTVGAPLQNGSIAVPPSSATYKLQ